MHIPEEAIEAAARADWTSYTEARGKEAFGDYPTFDSLPAYIQDKYRDDVRPMIEAAAHLIAQQAIRDEADKLDAWCGQQRVNAKDVATELRKNAADLTPVDCSTEGDPHGQ